MAKSVKKLWESKTAVIAVLESIGGLSLLIAEWMQVGDFSSIGIAMLVNGIAMFLLRLVTKEPVSL